jgi:hypothetical protein
MAIAIFTGSVPRMRHLEVRQNKGKLMLTFYIESEKMD